MAAPEASGTLAPAPWGSGAAFVIGAGGFLGGHVAEAFSQAGWRVIGFERREGRGVDAEALSIAAGRTGQPEVIFHAAGTGSVGAAAADPAADFDAGLGSLRATLDFMRRQAPAARLIFPSSAAVYGGGQAGAMTEDAPVAPISAYGLHKALCEQLVAGWARLYGFDAVSIRFFSLYGPGLRKQLLWDIARRIGEGAQALELFGDGAEQRDFLQVEDAVALIGRLAALPPGTAPTVINGGSGKAMTVRDAAQALAAAAGFTGPLRFNGEVRAGDPRSLVADIGLARGLGFAPKVEFEAGAAGFVDWAKKELSNPI
jgi:UDP-glucose 4-epimerase